MERDALIERLRDIIEKFLVSQGFDLVELVYRYEGRDLFLRVLADRSDGGITLDECASLNLETSRILDEAGILEHRYILEVSSPGLDRPLKTVKDFRRCLNREVVFFLGEAVSGRCQIQGTVKSVTDAFVYVESQGQVLEVPFLKINKARQVA